MVVLTERALAPLSAYADCEVRDGQALGLKDAAFDAALSCIGIFLFPSVHLPMRPVPSVSSLLCSKMSTPNPSDPRAVIASEAG